MPRTLKVSPKEMSPVTMVLCHSQRVTYRILLKKMCVYVALCGSVTCKCIYPPPWDTSFPQESILVTFLQPQLLPPTSWKPSSVLHLFYCIYIYIFASAQGWWDLSSLCMLSCFSHVQLFATLWTVARQAPPSMGFSRQEYWGCHALLQGIFLTQGLNMCLLHLLH